MAAQILVVDDLEVNRDMLARRLRQLGHFAIAATSGREALELLHASPCDMVLLDLMMPEMDGYAVLRAIKSDPALLHLPVIMISANDEIENVIKCIESGAEDYLPKPFNPVLLRARVEASLQKKKIFDREAHYQSELEQRVRAQVKEITSAQLAAIFAMSKLAESRDTETGAHLERMREYCRALARQLSKLAKYRKTLDAEFVEAIYAASPLHDIGKVGIPDQVLLKAGKLNLAEWEVMKTHALIGGATLRAVDAQHPGNLLIRMGIEIAEGHHEKWDGSGYPHALRGEAIPIAARILALADVYDALTSLRCYKKAFAHEEALHIIREGAGRHFDPEVVRAFLEIEAEFIRVRQCFKDAETSAARIHALSQPGPAVCPAMA
jgi:putative two-component system response regulator